MIGLVAVLRDSEQLELDLFPGVPWAGVSPRLLTKCRTSLFLRQEPPRHERFFDPEQLELWPAAQAPNEKGPRRLVSAGAPLLVAVKRTRRGRSLRFYEEE